jgi:hypothetical protein
MIVAGGVLAMVLACFAASPRAEAATPERSLDMPYVKYMDPVRRTALLDKAANAGADSIRVTLPWDHLEYAGDEQYEFAWLDNFLAAAEARNLKVRGQVSGAPPWVSPCSVWEPPVGSTDLNAYQDFMFDVVSRYGTRISSYEIWNEPNLADFWQCRSVNPTEYAAMLRSAYLGAKAANPNVTIVGGALSQNDIGYLERMYTALRAYPDAAANDDFFDALGVHPYAAKNGIALAPDADPAQANYTTAFGQKNSAFLGIDYMRATLDRHGDTHKPVWIGEFGYSTDNTWMLAVPDDVRADYLKTAYSLTDQRPWIIGLCWYNYYETDRGFTIYDYATGQETLTFQAFREVASEAQPPPPPTDTTAPQTSITSGPAEGSSTTSTSATFAFTSDEQGSTFKCQLYKDSTVTQVWAACTSPKVYSNLTPGKYEFEV